jgi:hypothetical protein
MSFETAQTLLSEGFGEHYFFLKSALHQPDAQTLLDETLEHASANEPMSDSAVLRFDSPVLKNKGEAESDEVEDEDGEDEEDDDGEDVDEEDEEGDTLEDDEDESTDDDDSDPEEEEAPDAEEKEVPKPPVKKPGKK